MLLNGIYMASSVVAYEIICTVFGVRCRLLQSPDQVFPEKIKTDQEAIKK